MSKKTQQNTTKQIIPLKYYQAMELRFDGYRYSEISKKINLSVGHLRTLFCKSGVLYDIYQDYTNKELKYRQKHARETLGAHIEDVARRLVQIVNTGSEKNAISAGKIILDRAMKENESTLENHNTSGISVVEVLKAIEKVERERR